MIEFLGKIIEIIESGNHNGLSGSASAYYAALAKIAINKFGLAPWDTSDFDYVFSMLVEDAEYCDVDGDEWTKETAIEYMREIFKRKTELDVMQKAFSFMKEIKQVDISLI